MSISHIGHRVHEHIGPKDDVKAEIITSPSVPKAGEDTVMKFYLKDKYGSDIKTLTKHHEREMHVFIVSEDMNIIGHVHPEDFRMTSSAKGDGAKLVAFTFPKGGRYLVAIDFSTKEGSYHKLFKVVVEGEPLLTKIDIDLENKKHFMAYPAESRDTYTRPIYIDESEFPLGEYFVSLSYDNELKRGEESAFNYHVTREGWPVKSFEPVLGTIMHVFIIGSKMNYFYHSHESNNGNSNGPDVKFRHVFPEIGVYTIFSQLKHEGKLIFTRFMIRVG